jgi:hypothetical protein
MLTNAGSGFAAYNIAPNLTASRYATKYQFKAITSSINIDEKTMGDHGLS